MCKLNQLIIKGYVKIMLKIALIILSILLFFFPNSSKLLNLWGRANHKNKDSKKAIAAFQRAIEIDPNKKETYLLLGDVIKSVEGFSKAKSLYRTAIFLGYRDPDLENKLAKLNKNILVFYGHLGSNFGDLGITLGTINLFKQINPKSNITFVTLPLSRLGNIAKNYLLSQYPDIKFIVYDIDPIQESFAYEDLTNEFLQSTYEKYSNDIDFVKQFNIFDMDLVVYNSGEHLFSYKKAETAHLLAWTLPYIVASRIVGKSVCLPSTFGPFYSSSAKEIFSKFATESGAVYAREINSMNLFKNEALEGTIKFNYGPDPAFFISEEFIDSIRPVINNKSNYLVLVPRLENYGLRAGKEKSKAYITKLRENNFSESEIIHVYHGIINYISSQEEINLVLLAQTYADVEICNVIYNKICKEKPELQSRITVIRPQDFGGYLALLGGAKAVITSRFHSIIFSLLLNKCPIGIYSPSHGQKIPGLLNQYNLSSHSFSTNQIRMEKLYELINKRMESSITKLTSREILVKDKNNFFASVKNIL